MTPPSASSRTIRPSGFIPAVDTGIRESKERFAGPPVSLVCWSHETRTSTDDVVVDMSLIPNAVDGDVAELRTLESKKPRKLYFIVKKLTDSVAKMLPGVQASVLTGNLLTLLDIPPRSKVEIRLKDKVEVEADLVEIHFKDTYLTRADMWRVSSSFIGKCFYATQRITYCDAVRCSINEIYRNGRKVFSAYIGPSTKFVYRSESARTIYFIQMSSEMWHFEENGEVMFHKLVNSFLPEVFKRWREQGAHHVVTIVLFTSVDVSGRKITLGHGEREQNTRDYFRVVVDQVHIKQWSDIMAALRFEFSQFAEEVQQLKSGQIDGTLLPAVKGNLMEAISLAMTMVTSKFLDRDLRQTNSQVIIVTPGSGIFDVDYELFYQTSLKLLSIEISIDLVCLSRPPLHVVPLFRFKRDNKVVNCVPSWLDISFWKSTEQYAKQWIPRCKIYEIQMMGVMENELSAISIEHLPRPNKGKSLEKLISEYDDNVFRPKKQAQDALAAAQKFEPVLLKPRVSSGDLLNTATSSEAMPASAIISSPAIDSQGGSTATSTAKLLSDSIKPKPRISALSSLLSLGKRRQEPGSNSSPWLAPVTATPPSTPRPGYEEESSSDTASVSDNATVTKRQTLTSMPSIDSLISSDEEFKKQQGIAITTQKTTTTLSPMSSPPRGPQSAMDQHRVRRMRRQASTGSQTSQLSSSPSGVHSGDLAENNYIWVTVENPSNVQPELVQNISNFGRWKNVFPTAVKRRAVKWRSLKSPASLPLATEIFPSVEEFERNYTFQIYDVTLDVEREKHMTAGNLLEEMISMRLMMGFQIVVGERVSQVEAQRRPGGNPALIVQAIPQDFHGVRIYMTRANQIHRLACDHYGTINVQLYSKPTLEGEKLSRAYHPNVRTKYEKEYQAALGNFFDPSIRNINWNLRDQQLAGFDDMLEPENSKLFRIRFVLIPSDLPSNHPLINEDDLDTEEIRLEGLRKIIQQLHKSSYMSEDERRRMKNRQKESKPPEIKFYTGELGDFLVSLLDSYKNYYEEFGSTRKKMFVNETMNKNTITLQQLANEMQQQGEKGVKLVARRWHWKLYSNCFVGQEFVAWLLDNFTDIETSEDAIEFGNELMEKGLFKHVDDRHAFLDGHYFYQLQPEYLKPEREKQQQSAGGGWFSKKLTDVSSNHRSSIGESASQKRRGSVGGGGDAATGSVISETSSAKNGNNDSRAMENTHPIDEPSKLPKILISRALMLDIDPNKRASRHEYLTVHVDRVHNPENAFHLRMEWINATPKLIDESVVNLGRIGERFGWKLVQVPIDEISSLPTGNPFCSFIQVPVDFSKTPLPSRDDPDLRKCGSNPIDEDPLYYHKYILEKNGFCLDTVSAASLMKKREVEILYSWGRPFYNFHQYIHKSGIVLAQIAEGNDFILMPNTLHISRAAVTAEQQEQKELQQKEQLYQHPSNDNPSAEHKRKREEPTSVADAERIMYRVQSICQDSEELSNVIAEAKQDWIKRHTSEEHIPSLIEESQAAV